MNNAFSTNEQPEKWPGGIGDKWYSKLTVIGCISIFLRPILEIAGLQDYGRATINEGGVEGNEMQSVDKSFTRAMDSILVFGIEFADSIFHYHSFSPPPTPPPCALHRLAEIHRPFTNLLEMWPTMEIDCTCIASVLSAATFPDTRNRHRVAVCCPDAQLQSRSIKRVSTFPLASLLIAKDWPSLFAFLTSTSSLILCIGPVCLL